MGGGGWFGGVMAPELMSARGHRQGTTLLAPGKPQHGSHYHRASLGPAKQEQRLLNGHSNLGHHSARAATSRPLATL